MNTIITIGRQFGSAGKEIGEKVAAHYGIQCYDKELLYKNMVEAKAEWLYTLEEWNPLITEERRAELYKEQKKSNTIVKEKKVGRNDPCPCGSGKKYKFCCGK